ncbi:hypothetical protein GLOIN_2v1790261 [Rhizophagus clarus]|nr:hypothetical protein GLOIN_2v1790261 [Rhizophagus clarus]
MIHNFKINSKDEDSKLLIGWMVVGNDTNFKSIFPDYNTKSFNNMQFKVLTFDHNLTKAETAEFDINSSSTEKHYYIGIPYTENKSDLVIDHYFSNDRKKLYTFSYSSKDKQSAKLSKFRFHLLEMTNSSTIFEKYVNHMNTINLDNIDELKNLKKIPKFISLYSKKEKRRPILLKQRPKQIKVKFFNDKFSFDKIIKKLLDSEDIKCSFFIPFER